MVRATATLDEQRVFALAEIDPVQEHIYQLLIDDVDNDKPVKLSRKEYQSSDFVGAESVFGYDIEWID